MLLQLLSVLPDRHPRPDDPHCPWMDLRSCKKPNLRIWCSAPTSTPALIPWSPTSGQLHPRRLPLATWYKSRLPHGLYLTVDMRRIIHKLHDIFYCRVRPQAVGHYQNKGPIEAELRWASFQLCSWLSKCKTWQFVIWEKIPLCPMGTNIVRPFEKWNKPCRCECFVFQNAPGVPPLDKHSTTPHYKSCERFLVVRVQP
jgi:hypothetical protein